METSKEEINQIIIRISAYRGEGRRISSRNDTRITPNKSQVIDTV
jgi:hypothetical protein